MKPTCFDKHKHEDLILSNVCGSPALAGQTIIPLKTIIT